MTSLRYSELVDRYTQMLREEPNKLRFSINSFTFLGVVLLVLSLILAVLMMVSLRPLLMTLSGLMLYGMFRVIFYRTAPPDAVSISREEAPLLYNDVDEITTQLGARACDGVYVNFDFNAYAIQYHTWGLFGRVRNYVVVGIPLLDCLGREHARSTLAHEVGHLQLKHGTRTRRWYAIADMYRSLDAQTSQGILSIFYAPFSRWYVPNLYARLHPITLRSEFEADAMEASVTSPETASEALCLMSVGVERTAKAIPSYLGRATREQGEPSASSLATEVYRALRQWNREEMRECVEKEMRCVTDIEGSHPALAERLGALGAEPAILEPPVPSASDLYFGDRREQIATRAATHYLATEEMQELVAKYQEYWQELPIAKERFDRNEATQEQAEYYVRGLIFVEDPASREALDVALERFPKSARLHYWLGKLKLEDDDLDGFRDWQAAAQLDEAGTGHIMDLTYRQLLALGKADEAREFRKRRDVYDDRIQSIYDARLKISKDEVYEPANFEEKDIEGVRFVLRQVKALGSAYLVRRVTDTPMPMYDLVIMPRKYRIVVDGNALTSEIETALAPLEKAINVFFGPWVKREVRERIAAVPGSKVYEA